LRQTSTDWCFRQPMASVSTGKLSIDLIVQGLEITFQFSPGKSMMSFSKSHSSSLNFYANSEMSLRNTLSVRVYMVENDHKKLLSFCYLGWTLYKGNRYKVCEKLHM
jgi:hypothetical protein